LSLKLKIHLLHNRKNDILSIFPSFHVLTDEKKFLYLFQCEEYDIVEVIVRGVNEMYNSILTQGTNPDINISFIMSSQFNHKFTVTNFCLRKLLY
jgi:hypothetical protein